MKTPTPTHPVAEVRTVRLCEHDMLESKSLQQPGPAPSDRTLKIEEEGDPFKGGIKPKIRLMGHWLERAGFKPGTRVSVQCLGPGVIELRSDYIPT